MQINSDGPNLPLYNASFSLYRLSPLHFPAPTPPFAQSTLKTHARRFQESLKGNGLRGIHARLEENEEVTARSGPLQECRWNLIQSEGSSTENEILTRLSHGADGLDVTEGIEIEVVYEEVKYNALMLGEANGERIHNDKEMHLPILLCRMPNATRGILLDYLSTAFDTHAETMKLTSQFLGNALEAFVGEAAKEEARNAIKIVKDIQLKVAFKGPTAPYLSSLDILVRRDDVPKFLEMGRMLSNNGRGQMGPPANKKKTSGPFMSAVRQYISSHLALDMTHDDVSVSRVACGAFALGREGKAKIFSPILSTENEDSDDITAAASREATKQLVKLLLSTATGDTQISSREPT